MTLGAGSRLGPYEIVSQLGAGGMGVVYQAHDPRLDRHVAIKLLPPDLTRDNTAKERFLQEAKAASALDHPNICNIHEINETDDGQLYLVMAHYDGETLKERIARGPLPLNDAIDIAKQVGEGLAKAHAAGIVHRDIKPANLMVTTDGTAKILDFGLAKLAGTDEVTQTRAAVGTVAYMSPEQARGEEVDRRTDIWSLGVVLYEMLSGQPPFRGENLLSLSRAITESEPASLTGSSSGAQSTLARALRKDRMQRFQHTTDFLDELRNAQRSGTTRTDGASSRAAVPSVAVLPFTNMSGDPEQEYFSDGLTEEIIADLSKIRALRVISRTSVMRFKNTEKDLRAIGRDLNVRYFLEGSVRKAGDRLRIVAQLVDTSEDVHLWGDKYNGSLEDVFDIQERVSREIASALEITLTPDDNRRVAQRSIRDARVFDCYLRAKHEAMRFTQDGLNRAVDLLRNGLQAFGDSALLHATLGLAYWQHVNTGLAPDQRYLERADACAAKALQLDPDSVPGRHLRGLILIHRGRAQEAMRELGRALRMEPDNCDVLGWRVALLAFVGKGASAETTRLREIDPLTPFSQMMCGLCTFTEGHFDAAVDQCRPWYDQDPDSPLFAVLFADMLARSGELAEASAAYGRLASGQPETMFGQLAQFLKHALDGERVAALGVVRPTLTQAARFDLMYSWDMATGYALIDERDHSFEWLEHAVDLGFVNYPFLAEQDPLLENLRRDGRFRPLMEDVRGRWERFQV